VYRQDARIEKRYQSLKSCTFCERYIDPAIRRPDGLYQRILGRYAIERHAAVCDSNHIDRESTWRMFFNVEPDQLWVHRFSLLRSGPSRRLHRPPSHGARSQTRLLTRHLGRHRIPPVLDEHLNFDVGSDVKSDVRRSSGPRVSFPNLSCTLFSPL
jgi:hypothetical protein